MLEHIAGNFVVNSFVYIYNVYNRFIKIWPWVTYLNIAIKIIFIASDNTAISCRFKNDCMIISKMYKISMQRVKYKILKALSSL